MAIKKKETPKKSMAKSPQLPVSSRMKTLPTVKPYREAPIERGQLEEVIVREKRPARKPSVTPKAPISSKMTTLPTVKAPEGKKMGRGRTALNDATSMVRGGVNVALGKNKSQTTGGKILERGARLIAGASGLYSTGAPNAVSTYANQMQKGTNKVTGYVQKGRKAAARGGLKAGLGMAALGTVVAPALIGQIGFKNRSEESKKRGIFNPGKNNSLPVNFDRPFQKKKTAAADSSSRSKKK
jgi:hypothetical protein